MVQRFGTRLMKIHRDVFLEISRPLLLPLSVKKESLFLKSKGRPWLPRFLRLLCSRDFSIELRCLAQFFLFFFLFKYIFIFMILGNSSNYQACFVIFDFRVIFKFLAVMIAIILFPWISSIRWVSCELIRILPALNNNYFHFYFSEINSIFARQNRNGGFRSPV